MLQNGDDERRQLEPRARRRHDGTLEEAQEAIDALSARLKRPTAKLQPPPTFVGPCTLWFSKCKLSESNNRKLLAKTAEELQAASTVPGGYFAPTGKAHSVAFAGFVNEEDLYLPAHQGPEENAPICTVNGCEAELVDPHETSDLDTYEGAKYGQLLERLGLGEYLPGAMLLGSGFEHLDTQYVEEISISCCAEGHVVGFVSATRVNFHTNKDSATDSTLVPALQRLSTRSE